MLHALREISIATAVVVVAMLAIAIVAAFFQVRPSDPGAAAVLVKTAMLIVPTVLAGYVLARRL